MSKLSLIASKKFTNDYNQRIEDLNKILNYLSYIDGIAQKISDLNALPIDQIPAYKPEKLIEVILKKNYLLLII